MNKRAFLITVVTFMLGPIFSVTRAAGQDVWRDYQEFEARRAALSRVGENHDVTSRYRRPVTHPRLIEIKRIQAINSKLTQTVSEGGTLKLRFVGRSATEINKRARRLQASLRFAKARVSDSKDSEANTKQLDAALALLRSSILALADNPVVRSPRLVDATQWAKAADDLERVIWLSDRVERICKTLASSTATR